MTIEQLEEAIAETERQEKLFRLAEQYDKSAWWIMQRFKLRGMLYMKMMELIR
jgi:hypothetical protein